MKLSFSTKGWYGYSFDDFCKFAKDFGYDGIELHNIHGEMFTEVNGAFHDYASSKTLHKLHTMSLSIPCIDAVCDIDGVFPGLLCYGNINARFTVDVDLA